MFNIKKILSSILAGSGEESSMIKHEIKNKKIFYVHVAKTGGTSINHIISSNYQKRNTKDHIEGYVHNKNYSKIEELKNKQFLSGHIKYKVARNIFGNNYYYITSFRDPIDHIISHLCWVKRLSLPEERTRFKEHDNNIQKLALKLGDVDFRNIKQLNKFLSNLDKTGKGLFDNCQTRYFANTDIIDRLVNRKDYISALKNIKNIDHIILLEDFQNGISRLTKKMKWDSKNTITKKNTTKEYFGLDKNNEDVLKLIKIFNKYDISLYKKVKKYMLSN